jgi:hypothetical protein
MKYPRQKIDTQVNDYLGIPSDNNVKNKQMKKIALVIGCILIAQFQAICQQNATTISTDVQILVADARQLPSVSLDFIRNNFPNNSVYIVNIEQQSTPFNILSYGVILNNGYYIEFSGNGDWREVDCHREAIPEVLIPAIIKNHIRIKYGGELVTAIEKDLQRTRIKLAGRKLISFDPNFNLIRIDE